MDTDDILPDDIIFKNSVVLTLFRMGLFRAAHEWGEAGEGGEGKKAPTLKSVTHILQ